MKRHSLLLSTFILASSCLFAIGATACDNGPNPADFVDFVVDVQTGRDIRVLQLTDVQTIDCTKKRYETRVEATHSADTYNGYEKYVGQVIESYQPDLIIMTGDNVYGEFDDDGEQHVKLIQFMDSFQIPWAPVFGNHDIESNMGVDWQCQQFENSQYCLFKQRELTGNGNYSVGLTQGGKLKRVFYMLDSNGSGHASRRSLANGHTQTTSGFGDDQIEWYTQSITALKEQFPDVKLSMAFHIQMAAFEDALTQYDYYSSSQAPIDLDNLPAAQQKGDFGYIGCSAQGGWDTRRTVWTGIKELGIDSIFVGHEHANSWSIEYEGVRLTFGQKSSTFDSHNVNETGPVMGGTYIHLSQTDGAIADAGLYLYDHAKGYKPNDKPAPQEPTPPQQLPYTAYDLSSLENMVGGLSDEVKFASLNDDCYSVRFTLTPHAFDGTLECYGYTTEDRPKYGLRAYFSKTTVRLTNASTAFNFELEKSYAIEMGFIPLYDGNTAYVFLKIDGNLVVWERMEVFDKTSGNFSIASYRATDSFTLS